MTLREAEKDAADLLTSVWWTDSARTMPLPVHPRQVAEGLGIKVEKAWLASDESGNIVIPATGQVVISINMFDHENRQRFTCAHEIGHYISRRKQPGAKARTFVDYRNTLAGLGKDTDEIYANQFAAALLMPAHLVRDGYREGGTAELLALRFGTSTQALSLRLRNLGLT